MKRTTIVLLMLSAMNVSAQSYKSVIKEYKLALSQIRNADFDYTYLGKYPTTDDTIKEHVFVKISALDYYKYSLFKFDQIRGDSSREIFTGDYFIKLQDSLAIVPDTNDKYFTDKVNANPFISSVKSLEKRMEDKENKFSLTKDSLIGSFDCKSVTVTVPLLIDNLKSKVILCYYFEKKSKLLIAFEKTIFFRDYTQFESYTINNFKVLNISGSAVNFTIDSIPKAIKVVSSLRQVSPGHPPILIKMGELFPSFLAKSIDSISYSLDTLNYKLLILDFSYKNCYPCLKAIPGIVKIYDEYKSKGLQILGIDPFDKADSATIAFIKKQKINYPYCIDDKKTIAHSCNVSSYPTTIVLDRNHRVLYTAVGFSEELYLQLRELIKSKLEE